MCQNTRLGSHNPTLAPSNDIYSPLRFAATLHTELPKLARGLLPTAKSEEVNRSVAYLAHIRVALPVFSL